MKKNPQGRFVGMKMEFPALWFRSCSFKIVQFYLLYQFVRAMRPSRGHVELVPELHSLFWSVYQSMQRCHSDFKYMGVYHF